MPTFSTRDGIAYCSIVTGPRHCTLGIKFGSTCPVRVIAGATIGSCDHGQLDADKVLEAALRGIETASRSAGAAPPAVEEIHYVTNDTQEYGLYRRAAYLITQRLLAGLDTDG